MVCVGLGPAEPAHMLVGILGKLARAPMVGNWRKGTLLAPFQPGVMPVPAGFLQTLVI